MSDEKPADADTANLSAEVESLRAELAAQKGQGGARGGWWRTPICFVLLALVVLLAPLTVVARWVHSEVADTDKYVATVAPLASDPDVQEALARRITNLIFQYVDVSDITDEAASALERQGLSSRASDGLRALSGPIDGAVQNFVSEKVLAVVQSDAFEQAWVNANRQAHNQMVAALTGETDGAVTVQGDEVRVSMAAFVETVKAALVDQGFRLAERIPPIDATFVVLDTSQLSKAQNGFHLLDLAATVLPVITLLLAALAIFAARKRRTALIAAALCIAAGMILLGLVLAGLRPLYLDALPASSSQAAAATVYDTLIASMRRNLRIVGVTALLIAVVAWLAGPSTSARRIRSGAVGSVTWVRENARGYHVDTGDVGHTLWDLRNPIQIGIVTLGLLSLLWSLPLSAAHFTWTVVLMLLAWFVLQVLATPREVTADGVGTDGAVKTGDDAAKRRSSP
jgi:hypothetical protein